MSSLDQMRKHSVKKGPKNPSKIGIAGGMSLALGAQGAGLSSTGPGAQMETRT